MENEISSTKAIKVNIEGYKIYGFEDKRNIKRKYWH